MDAATKFDRVKNSNLWDEVYHVPIIPRHNNPWIYMAYVCRCLGEPLPAELLTSIADWFRKCEVLSGFIQRYPHGGLVSHDELMGAAHLSQEFAARAVVFLATHDNLYTVALTPQEEDNVSRFIFLLPYLRARAGVKLSLWSQFLFSAHVLHEALTGKVGQHSGTLKIWMMAPEMRKFGMTKLALHIWQTVWTNRGINPQVIFKKHYLTECPVMGEIAEPSFE